MCIKYLQKQKEQFNPFKILFLLLLYPSNLNTLFYEYRR